MAEKTVHDPSPLTDLSDGPSSFDSFMEKNQKFLSIGAVVLILGGAGWMVQRAIKQGNAESAATELAAAKTPDALKEVATKRAGTPAGPTASLLLAEEQWKGGQQDASIATLRELLSGTSEHPAIYTGRASLAVKLMQQGKKDEATTLFSQVVSDPKSKYLAPYALICLGDLAKADGKIDEASSAYTRAKNDFGPTNAFSQVADQHMTLLKFKLPTEIEAPPAADPAAPGAEGAPAGTPELQGNPLFQNFQPPASPEATPETGDPAPAEPAPAPAEPGKSN